jgi:peptide/nickel transport system substrate-binding protein
MWFLRYLTLALLATGCAQAQRTRQTPDDTLVYLLPDVIRDLDPRFAITNYDTKLSRLLVPGLTTVDNAPGVPEMLLAEGIERIDDKTWEVTLKPDLRCSDGSEFSAADVVFTYRSVLASDGKSLFQKAFEERFRSVVATDDRHVRFELVAPLSTFETDIEFGVLCESTSSQHLVGAGPYRLRELAEDGALFEPNPYYFGPTPDLHARFLVVRDGNARALMLAGGSADATQNGIRIDLVNELTKRDRLALEAGPSSLLTYLMMQNRDPILKDLRVRQAIAYALDREAIISARFHGYARLATGLLPPGNWAYRGDVKRYGPDRDKARALLDAAGYPDADGSGPKSRLQLIYKTSSDPFRVAVARLIAEQLAEVGITVEVRSFEFGTVFADIKNGNFQLASMQTAEINEPDSLFTYYHSSRIPSEADPNAHNRWRFENAKLDALLEAGRLEPDRERRRELYGEAQSILAEELPVIPLWHEDNLLVRNRDLEGVKLWPNARLSGLLGAKKVHGGESVAKDQ